MATAKFITPFLKSSETTGETLQYDLNNYIITTDFIDPTYKVESATDGVEIVDGVLYVDGHLYISNFGIIVSDKVATITVYVNIVSASGKFNLPGGFISKQSEFQALKENWQDFINGTYNGTGNALLTENGQPIQTELGQNITV